MVVIKQGDIANYFISTYINWSDYNQNTNNNANNTLYKSNFLQNSIYLLKTKNEEQINNDKIQWLIARNKLYTGDSNFSDNFKDILKYTGIPENLLPAVYIPFYQSSEVIASSINFNMLTLNDTLPDSFYLNTYKTFSKPIDDKKDLQDLLHNQIKNLNDPTKTYNNFDLTIMIIFVCILWFVIILTLLKIVYYYYSEYYNIIIIVMTVLMLIGMIIWKMSNVIRS